MGKLIKQLTKEELLAYKRASTARCKARLVAAGEWEAYLAKKAIANNKYYHACKLL